MNKDEDRPKVIAGAFIFNEKDELFLMRQPKFNNKYTSPGGKVEGGESVKEAVIREVKEETNMDVKDVEFITWIEGRELKKKYNVPLNNAVFLDHRAKVKNCKNIIINDEGTEYKWLKIEDWLKNKKEVEEYTFVTIKEYLSKQEDDFEHLYKSALADYQNLLKRTAKEKDEFFKYAKEQIINEVIPVYDNLKMSVDHFNNDKHQDEWLQGIKYILKQFNDVLKNNGVEEIETVGKEFDHNIMDALEGKGKKVKKEVRAGYKLNGKVIIPAKVILE